MLGVIHLLRPRKKTTHPVHLRRRTTDLLNLQTRNKTLLPFPWVRHNCIVAE